MVTVISMPGKMDRFDKHYFDLQRYHNTEYWEGIKQGIQSDCANRYKDRKTKLKKHFDKVGGYDNTERAKTKPPEGMNPDAWVRVIEELFTTPTYQKRSQANSTNRSKQLYGSYHGTQSYAQRRYTEVQETGVAKHVEGWREMHCKGSSGWYNEMAETHWEETMDTIITKEDSNNNFCLPARRKGHRENFRHNNNKGRFQQGYRQQRGEGHTSYESRRIRKTTQSNDCEQSTNDTRDKSQRKMKREMKNILS
ncbi:hypothetical protein E3N88_13822 [Mikania micrantha]|uniref:Uncharacterized protein n=1 Tax=Mikania micrantha TaxID=192012 RepID=A0A5N6P018_9ASTR|nr:hypothetical protein E3N88_13822 [Mikania micrantha]